MHVCFLQHNSYVPVAPLGAAPTPNPSHQSSSIPATSVPSHAPVPEDVQLAMSINASFQSALAEGVPVPSAQPVNLTANTNGWDPTSENTSYNGWAQSGGAPPPPKLEPTPDPYNRWSGVRPSSSSPQLHTSRLETQLFFHQFTRHLLLFQFLRHLQLSRKHSMAAPFSTLQ